MNFNLDNYYMMKKQSPHDCILSTYEILEKMSKLWQGIDVDEVTKMANVGNINACSAEEVGVALSKFSEKMNNDKFKKPEVEYKIL